MYHPSCKSCERTLVVPKCVLTTARGINSHRTKLQTTSSCTIGIGNGVYTGGKKIDASSKNTSVIHNVPVNVSQDICKSGGRDGEFCGRGDEGRPIILECRFPRSEVVTATFRPRLAATWDAFDVFEAVGVSGGVTRMAGSGPRFVTLWIGLDGVDDSMVISPSVVSVPLSS